MFSHLYGPLPKQLIGKPAIVNVFGNKKAKAEEWCGAQLHEVSKWARGLTNTIYTANFMFDDDMRTAIERCIEDEFAPGRGWFPLELPDLLMIEFMRQREVRGITVFDGFMGRGTVGKSARELQCEFIGIDRNPDRVQIAREYLGC